MSRRSRIDKHIHAPRVRHAEVVPRLRNRLSNLRHSVVRGCVDRTVDFALIRQSLKVFEGAGPIQVNYRTVSPPKQGQPRGNTQPRGVPGWTARGKAQEVFSAGR